MKRVTIQFEINRLGVVKKLKLEFSIRNTADEMDRAQTFLLNYFRLHYGETVTQVGCNPLKFRSFQSEIRLRRVSVSPIPARPRRDDDSTIIKATQQYLQRHSPKDLLRCLAVAANPQADAPPDAARSALASLASGAVALADGRL